MSIDHTTPGPWEVADGAFDNEGCPETVIRGWSGRACVAVALDFGANNPLMREANARLIAAAPEMLLALLDAQSFIRNGIALGFIRMPDKDCPDPAHETPKVIAAAIAKATGAQP